MKIEDLVQALQLEVKCGKDYLNREVTGGYLE